MPTTPPEPRLRRRPVRAVSMPSTALLIQHNHQQVSSASHPAASDLPPAHAPHDIHLYMISEHHHGHPLITIPCAHACANHSLHTFATPPRPARCCHSPRPLMATLAYAHEVHSPFGAPPGSPPELSNSKSSKSSSFHSSALSDFQGTSDLSHFEEINLDETTAAPSSFQTSTSPSNRVIFEAPKASCSHLKNFSSPNIVPHSFRDLTAVTKPRYPSGKFQGQNTTQRQSSQLTAPSQQRRGFSSSSISSLAAPSRSSRSQSPSTATPIPASPRTLSRRSSRNLHVLPSPPLHNRRLSWQNARRKSVKEKEAECDDEDDELPDDAVIWNVPISPRPMQDRSPATSAFGSPPRPASEVSSIGASSSKTSPTPSLSRHSSRAPSPNVSIREGSPNELSRQRTAVWEDTYITLDSDAKKLTEVLEVFQAEVERKQEVSRQLTRSASLNESGSKSQRHVLPPVRRSDPLIDPFQPSIEKEKYLSRTRPSWLPPKNPKEEKKHLREYQRMLARMEENERLEAKRAQEQTLARENISRTKAEYWSTVLLPNWSSEMSNPELVSKHRRMWWSGVPASLRGQVWQNAVGNDLEVTEGTYNIALEKATMDVQQNGYEALGGRYANIVETTTNVFSELKMFGGCTAPDAQDEQPLHQDLVNICIAYATYRPDLPRSSSNIPHVAALLLLNLTAPQAFITLVNLLNRPLPLSFLVHDANAIHAAFVTTINAMAKKSHSGALRLETLRVEPCDYLPHMFSSLFCARLGLEHAARVMDVYAIEGDKTLPRVAVAIMCILEGSCIEGNAQHVARVLRNKKFDMDAEDFMDRVYEAGKI